MVLTAAVPRDGLLWDDGWRRGPRDLVDTSNSEEIMRFPRRRVDHLGDLYIHGIIGGITAVRADIRSIRSEEARTLLRWLHAVIRLSELAKQGQDRIRCS